MPEIGAKYSWIDMKEILFLGQLSSNQCPCSLEWKKSARDMTAKVTGYICQEENKLSFVMNYFNFFPPICLKSKLKQWSFRL